jgi:hypothetical protein
VTEVFAPIFRHEDRVVSFLASDGEEPLGCFSKLSVSHILSGEFFLSLLEGGGNLVGSTLAVGGRLAAAEGRILDGRGEFV